MTFSQKLESYFRRSSKEIDEELCKKKTVKSIPKLIVNTAKISYDYKKKKKSDRTPRGIANSSI